MAKKSKRQSKDLKMFEKLDENLKENNDDFDFYFSQERFGDEIIVRKNVADADLEYMQLFGANKNLYRTICSLIDGLKPGKRRLLYSWWDELEKRPTDTKPETLRKRRFIKVDKLSSTTQGLHPHATTSIDDLIGREGQYWSNNAMLLDAQGSYGNMRGDTWAAGRYREARISEYTLDCFFDNFDNYCIPMKVAYDGYSMEPEILPAKYPHVLFNPQFSGIGYGLSSNIPPFNVTEVLDATIKLINNPDAKIMLVPDSPTGCDVLDEGLFKEINKSGQAKVTFIATTEIDYSKNVIKVTSLPLNSSSKDTIDKIIAMRAKGNFDEIVEIKDYTLEGEVLIEFYLKPDAKPDKVLKRMLKKKTGLRTTFPVVITVIDDYQEYEYGIKDLLKAWIDYRVDLVRSMLLNTYQQLIAKKHMNEVLLYIFEDDHADVAQNIARAAKSRKDSIELYMRKFGITSVQAATITDMHLYNFNEDSHARYIEEGEKLNERLDEVEELLSDDINIKKYIINQLEEGKKKWGRPRMSKIIKENDDDMDNVPDTEHLIAVSESGWIKKLLAKDNSSIGAVGKTGSNLTVLKVNNRENLLLVDSTGNVVKIPISAVPDMAFNEIGVELKKFFSVKGDIKAVMELPSMDVLNTKDESMGIIFITKQGMAKKVQISEFKKITGYKKAITLNDGDEVASAIFAFNTLVKDIIIVTNQGNGIRLPINDIKNASLVARGLNTLTLREGEEVVSASIINPKKKLLFYITSAGRAKVTESKYFSQQQRKGETLSLIALQGNETLLGVSSVTKNDIIEVYHKVGEPEQVAISNLEPTTRIAKGEKLFKVNRGDTIIAYKVFG